MEILRSIYQHCTYYSLLQIGTYQTAVCSKAHNKPFYVVAESFKFVRLYPLNQQDVPDKFKVREIHGYLCYVL